MKYTITTPAYIRWTDPDDDTCSRIIAVEKIERHGDIIRVYGRDGSYLEAAENELSEATTEMEPYYTVVIPPRSTSDPLHTGWHSDTDTLTRGVFKSKADACEWAERKIGVSLRGTNWNVKLVTS